MSNQRIITFYLPQYHPIPENNEWWGKGFTDWKNVVKGKPRFFGHYQPHLPSDLGFYDLRLEETRIAQAEMANEYGINGFCYYHYWFNGKMLLEKPFNEVLKTGKPDFPFCLCWANENWTRQWDGLEKEILIEQNYDKYDSKEHMAWLLNAFSDKRYMKIDGKPLFLIYNTIGIPGIKAKISEWRRIVKEQGFPNIYLCSVKSLRNKMSDKELIELGFDALVDFIPNGETNIPRKVSSFPRYYLHAVINKIIKLTGLENKIPLLTKTIVHDYEALVDRIIKRNSNEFKTFPCVVPGWDNSARKKTSAVLQNDNAELYEKWLENSFEKVRAYPDSEQIVFINAWNEWAEGCHLEPDQRNGKKFLEATLKVIRKLKSIKT